MNDPQSFLMININFLKNSVTQKMGSAMITYLDLRSFSDSHAKPCFPSISTLAKMQGCSINTVTNHLKKLRQSGLINVEQRYNGTNIYTFILERECMTPPQKTDPPLKNHTPLPKKITATPPKKKVHPPPRNVVPTPNFLVHPSPENCDLTRVIELDLNNQNHITPTPPSKLLPRTVLVGQTMVAHFTLPPSTPLLATIPITDFSNAMVLVEKMEGKEKPIKPAPNSLAPVAPLPPQKPLVIPMLEWVDFYKSRIDYKKINNDLLEFVAADFKDSVREKLLALWKNKNTGWFLPKVLLDKIKNETTIKNPGAFINSVLSNGSDTYYLLQMATAEWQSLRSIWDHKNRVISDQNKYNREVWEEQNERRPAIERDWLGQYNKMLNEKLRASERYGDDGEMAALERAKLGFEREIAPTVTKSTLPPPIPHEESIRQILQNDLDNLLYDRITASMAITYKIKNDTDMQTKKILIENLKKRIRDLH